MTAKTAAWILYVAAGLALIAAVATTKALACDDFPWPLVFPPAVLLAGAILLAPHGGRTRRKVLKGVGFLLGVPALFVGTWLAMFVAWLTHGCLG